MKEIIFLKVLSTLLRKKKEEEGEGAKEEMVIYVLIFPPNANLW